MKPQKEYKEGLIWVAPDNPLGLRKGYYTSKQIESVLDKNPDKVRAWYKFIEK